jgi:hypothetical protein
MYYPWNVLPGIPPPDDAPSDGSPYGWDGSFHLASYDDPTLCVDIDGGKGPRMEMYRCKGIAPQPMPKVGGTFY